MTGRELDPAVRDELRRLSRETADRVAGHLVSAAALLEDDPEQALRHAQFAARIGGRVGAVRETYGAIAYELGDFRTAVKELRTALRITGRADILPMIADCERGLGRPEKALDVASSPEAGSLDLEATIELMIVVAGAYADTGDLETALASLEMPGLRRKVAGRWQVRLWVAYADLLERAGRTEEARRWLTLAADADTERVTDAAERLGRPAPPVVDPGPWEDDERLTVLDAFVDIDEEADGASDDVDEERDDASDDVDLAHDGGTDDEEPSSDNDGSLAPSRDVDATDEDGAQGEEAESVPATSAPDPRDEEKAR